MITQFKYLLFLETHLYSSDPWFGIPALFVEHSDAQCASKKSQEGISRLTFFTRQSLFAESILGSNKNQKNPQEPRRSLKWTESDSLPPWSSG